MTKFSIEVYCACIYQFDSKMPTESVYYFKKRLTECLQPLWTYLYRFKFPNLAVYFSEKQFYFVWNRSSGRATPDRSGGNSDDLGCANNSWASCYQILVPNYDFDCFFLTITYPKQKHEGNVAISDKCRWHLLQSVCHFLFCKQSDRLKKLYEPYRKICSVLKSYASYWLELKSEWDIPKLRKSRCLLNFS